MANSSFSETITHATATPAAMAVPNAGTIHALRGFPLNDCWKIGDQLPTVKQNGATVYLVHDKGDLPVEGLEAHAFVLDGTQPKIRKHRLRCVKRMAHRTRMAVKVQDVFIIVIATRLEAEIQASEKHKMIDMTVAMHNSPKTDGKVAAKTTYNQESARIRQKERRQAGRCGTAEQHPDNLDTEKKRTKTITLDDPKTDFTAFMIALWILYDETGAMREKMPIKRYDLVKKMGYESFYDAVENYLKQTPIELDSSADMESCLRTNAGK